MPQKITAYQAADGSIHPDACAAAKCDLDAIVQASPLAENQPYAKLALEWLTDRADVILKVLGEYHTSCPKVVQAEAAPKTAERTRSSPKPHFAGKSKITVLNGLGEETRIPGGVYWSGEQSNFYDAGNDKGMGQHFFDDWYGSRMIFPQHKEDALHGLNHEGVHDFRKEDA